MGTRLAFDRLVHSDWSLHSQKRWTAVAHRSRSGWLIDSLRQTPTPNDFLNFLFDQTSRTLAGFDFPIGLPMFYLNKMKLEFCQLLSAPASDRSRSFLLVVETLSDISPAQPFYRKHPRGGRHPDLLRGLECETFGDLLRECEKKNKIQIASGVDFLDGGRKAGGQSGAFRLAGNIDARTPAQSTVRWRSLIPIF